MSKHFRPWNIDQTRVGLAFAIIHSFALSLLYFRANRHAAFAATPRVVAPFATRLHGFSTLCTKVNLDTWQERFQKATSSYESAGH
jgi:hypothetical protein